MQLRRQQHGREGEAGAEGEPQEEAEEHKARRETHKQEEAERSKAEANGCCSDGSAGASPRSRALVWSASATSATNPASLVNTSPPLTFFIELSICWPRPPAPTKPSTTELRMAHSQR